MCSVRPHAVLLQKSFRKRVSSMRLFSHVFQAHAIHMRFNYQSLLFEVHPFLPRVLLFHMRACISYVFIPNAFHFHVIATSTCALPLHVFCSKRVAHALMFHIRFNSTRGMCTSCTPELLLHMCHAFYAILFLQSTGALMQHVFFGIVIQYDFYRHDSLVPAPNAEVFQLCFTTTCGC